MRQPTTSLSTAMITPSSSSSNDPPRRAFIDPSRSPFESQIKSLLNYFETDIGKKNFTTRSSTLSRPSTTTARVSTATSASSTEHAQELQEKIAEIMTAISTLTTKTTVDQTALTDISNHITTNLPRSLQTITSLIDTLLPRITLLESNLVKSTHALHRRLLRYQGKHEGEIQTQIRRFLTTQNVKFEKRHEDVMRCFDMWREDAVREREVLREDCERRVRAEVEAEHAVKKVEMMEVLQKQREGFDGEVERMKKNSELERRGMEERYQRDIEVVKMGREEALRKQREEFNTHVEGLKEKAEMERREMEERYKQEMEVVKLEREKAILGQREEFDRDLMWMMEEGERAINNAVAAAREEERDTFLSQLETIQQEADAKLRHAVSEQQDLFIAYKSGIEREMKEAEATIDAMMDENREVAVFEESVDVIIARVRRDEAGKADERVREAVRREREIVAREVMEEIEEVFGERFDKGFESNVVGLKETMEDVETILANMRKIWSEKATFVDSESRLISYESEDSSDVTETTAGDASRLFTDADSEASVFKVANTATSSTSDDNSTSPCVIASTFSVGVDPTIHSTMDTSISSSVNIHKAIDTIPTNNPSNLIPSLDINSYPHSPSNDVLFANSHMDPTIFSPVKPTMTTPLNNPPTDTPHINREPPSADLASKPHPPSNDTFTDPTISSPLKPINITPPTDTSHFTQELPSQPSDLPTSPPNDPHETQHKSIYFNAVKWLAYRKNMRNGSIIPGAWPS